MNVRGAKTYNWKKMDKLNIKKRIGELNDQGINISMIDLGRELWPDADLRIQRNSISMLCNGKRTSIKLGFIPIICGVLQCDANYLFNIE